MAVQVFDEKNPIPKHLFASERQIASLSMPVQSGRKLPQGFAGPSTPAHHPDSRPEAGDGDPGNQTGQKDKLRPGARRREFVNFPFLWLNADAAGSTAQPVDATRDNFKIEVTRLLAIRCHAGVSKDHQPRHVAARAQSGVRIDRIESWRLRNNHRDRYWSLAQSFPELFEF